MKFERITNEAFGAQQAGYTFDLDAPIIIDEDARAFVLRERGERYLSSCVDSFFDCDGDLYRGDDDELYIVGPAYVDGPGLVPLIYRRAIPRKWYAVMRDNEDTDWGTGSYDLDEAKAMARQWREDGSPDAYIAVIDEAHKVCVDEIREEA